MRKRSAPSLAVEASRLVPARTERTLETFDDHHSTAEAWAALRVGGRAGGNGLGGGGVRRFARGLAEQRPAPRQILGAMAVGEQAVVTDAMEAVRQHVHQEPAHELCGGEAHHLGLRPALGAVIFPAECDMIVSQLDEPAVCDGERNVCERSGSYPQSSPHFFRRPKCNRRWVF